MDNETYARRLHAAVLQELGITEPPFQLRVEMDVGGTAVKLLDARSGVDAFGEGEFVSAVHLNLSLINALSVDERNDVTELAIALYDFSLGIAR